MSTMNLTPVLKQRFFDHSSGSGAPLSGGQLFSYQAGTVTPQQTYTDQSGVTPNANPIILDANGECNLWLDPTLSYKFVLQDSLGNTQWTVDNVIGLLAANAVNTAAIQAAAVTTAKLAANSVTSAILASDASVDANRAVQTNHIQNLNVTTGKIAANAVDRTKLAADIQPPKNYLINGAFDVWQRGTSVTVTNGNSGYGPDQWYAKNSLGTNGVITLAQLTGSVNDSKYGCSVKISTAPTLAQANGCELYHVLENIDSLNFYSGNASLSAQIKALGNVNQVGVQFFYATSEAKLTTAIGSEVLVTVNSSSFSAASIVNQAMGTSQTASGVVGVRIRITGVSTGNTYDLNNGFVVEQVSMCKEAIAPTFQRIGSMAQELQLCQRYFVSIPTGSSFSIYSGIATTNACNFPVPIPVPMRVVPTIAQMAGLNIAWNGGSSAISSPVIQSVNGNLLIINATITNAGGSTPGAVYADGTSHWFSAEI